MPPDILTIKEAAEILGVHPNTIRNYIRRKLLPAFKWGGEKSNMPWRINKSDLDSFAAGKLGVS